MISVEIADVSFRHRRGGGVQAITLTAAPGERIALFGDSGSGKTTLLRLIAGEHSPETGTVHIDGRSPAEFSSEIGFIRQSFSFAPLQTIHSTLSKAVRSVASSQRPARIAEMLDLFDLYESKDRYVREMSWGEQAAVAAAVVLIQRPTVLLVDNLLAALPANRAVRTLAFIDDRRREDRSIVIQATTVSTEAETADRAVILDSGAVLATGSPADLMAAHASDIVTVEAADPASIQPTLRGIYDLEIEESGRSVRFSVADGESAAAHLFRHPPEGLRVVHIRKPDLWDVLCALRTGRMGE